VNKPINYIFLYFYIFCPRTIFPIFFYIFFIFFLGLSFTCVCKSSELNWSMYSTHAIIIAKQREMKNLPVQEAKLKTVACFGSLGFSSLLCFFRSSSSCSSPFCLVCFFFWVYLLLSQSAALLLLRSCADGLSLNVTTRSRMML
jgi:hypothetical protein